MVSLNQVTPTIAVSDLAAAKEFYGGILGLKQIDEHPAGVVYESGGTKLLVYPSAFAGTNRATYASWHVDDIEAVVAELKSKGVSFQRFDIPDTTWEGDVAVWDNMKSAWFTDPDGNVLALDNM